MTLVPSLARAEGVTQIRKGAPAPSDGVFYTTEAHALLVSKLKGMDAKCDAEKEFLAKQKDLDKTTSLRLKDIDLTIEKQKLELIIKATDEQKKLLLGQINNPPKVPWYKTFGFGVTTGVLLTALVTSLVIWGASEFRK